MGQPSTIDLIVVKGDDDTIDFSIDNPKGTNVNLANYTAATFTVKDRWGGTQVFQKTVAAGGIVFQTPYADGVARVTIAAADTAGVTITTGQDRTLLVWDLDITHNDGKKATVARGTFTVLQAA